jgi:F-type H+-transporting ATPase subunit delta
MALFLLIFTFHAGGFLRIPSGEPVSESHIVSASQSSVPSQVIDRYARTLFELAGDAKALDTIEADARAILAACAASPDLTAALASPLHPVAEKVGVIAALAKKMKLQKLTSQFVGVMAANGRADALAPVMAAVLTLAARARGAVIAEVATASALSAEQTADLKGALERAFKAPVDIDATVRPELIGGLTVKVGSRLFDDSIKSKLDALKLAMKGA